MRGAGEVVAGAESWAGRASGADEVHGDGHAAHGGVAEGVAQGPERHGGQRGQRGRRAVVRCGRTRGAAEEAEPALRHVDGRDGVRGLGLGGGRPGRRGRRGGARRLGGGGRVLRRALIGVAVVG